MLLTLDFIAQRYSVLPSELIAKGDVVDLNIAIIGSEYAKWVQQNPELAKAGANNHGLSQLEMQNAINRVRGQT